MIRQTLFALTILMTGCASLKDKTGEFVTEAVQDRIISKVDELLARRNLTLTEIQQILDQDGSNEIDSAEVLTFVKDLSKDYMLLEGKELVDRKLAELQNNLVSQDELRTKSSEFWNWLMSAVGILVSSYLGKQIVSARSDGKRDARIALIEKILQKDLNGDGTIGAIAVSNGDGVNPPPPIQS